LKDFLFLIGFKGQCQKVLKMQGVMIFLNKKIMNKIIIKRLIANNNSSRDTLLVFFFNVVLTERLIAKKL